jgi:thiol-disulfide isomerase/thioredoxin
MIKKNIGFILVSVLVAVVTVALIIRSMSPRVKVLPSNNTTQDGIFVVMASWCGYCKQLKKSGELEKLSENMEVITIPHDHPGAENFMKSVGANGFPAIVMVKNSALHKYNGERSAEAMVENYIQL